MGYGVVDVVFVVLVIVIVVICVYGDDCAHGKLVEVISDDVMWPAALVMMIVVMFVLLMYL